MYPGALLWLALSGGSTISLSISSNSQDLFTTEDYPRSALLEQMEGSVRYRLDLHPDGSVKDCIILQSSGHSLLDDTTCQILARRAKFHPLARNDQGARYSTSGTIKWQLPGRAFQPNESSIEFNQDASGLISGCVEKEKFPSGEELHACSDLIRDSEGALRRPKQPIHVRIRTIMEVEPINGTSPQIQPKP